MHILFVSPYVPSPIRVRPYNFIKALARRGHAITLICSSSHADAAALAELRTICQRVETVHLGRDALIRNALRALPQALPLQAALNLSPHLLELVHNEARSGTYDVAHIEHLRGSALVRALDTMPTVLDAVDCISLLFERALRGSPSVKSRAMALIDLARTRAYEAGYVERYDQVLVSSPEDAWALATLRSLHLSGRAATRTQASSIAVVPNGVDLAYFAPQPVARERATIVFSGKMSYHANAAAALFLGHQIMPLIWRHRPDVRLVLAGSAPGRPVRALAADPRIEVTGHVPDLRTYLARASLAIAPLRYAVGIQNKVLEAMAMGTPVIAARQTAQALHTEAGRDLLLAEHATEYAEAVLELLADPARAAALGAAGRRYVEHHHNWHMAAAQLEALYAAARAAPVRHHDPSGSRSLIPDRRQP